MFTFGEEKSLSGFYPVLFPEKRFSSPNTALESEPIKPQLPIVGFYSTLLTLALSVLFI